MMRFVGLPGLWTHQGAGRVCTQKEHGDFIPSSYFLLYVALVALHLAIHLYPF